MHQSAITLKPLIDEVNNIDHIITGAPVKGVSQFSTLMSCLDGWVRESSKWQASWGILFKQWLIPDKIGPSKENQQTRDSHG